MNSKMAHSAHTHRHTHTAVAVNSQSSDY